MSKTVLVTGAAGLIGSSVTRQLLAAGHNVVACDDFSTGSWKAEDASLHWDTVDISSPRIEELLSTHKVQTVIHCAAHPGGLSLQDPVKDVSVNALGGMRIFNWCARNGAHAIFLSSSVVYGPNPPHSPILESAPLRPGTIYGVNKVACENYLKILGEGYGLKWTVLRLFATYGAGHKPNLYQGIVNILLTQMMTGSRVVVKGSLHRVRDVIYVDDAAAAIVSAVTSPKAVNEVINISTGNAPTVRFLMEHIAGALGKSLNDFEIIEEPGTVGDPFYNVANCRKAEELLHFCPSIDLNSGLAALLASRRGKS